MSKGHDSKIDDKSFHSLTTRKWKIQAVACSHLVAIVDMHCVSTRQLSLFDWIEKENYQNEKNDEEKKRNVKHSHCVYLLLIIVYLQQKEIKIFFLSNHLSSHG